MHNICIARLELEKNQNAYPLSSLDCVVKRFDRHSSGLRCEQLQFTFKSYA